jgi:hypothetical protein
MIIDDGQVKAWQYRCNNFFSSCIAIWIRLTILQLRNLFAETKISRVAWLDFYYGGLAWGLGQMYSWNSGKLEKNIITGCLISLIFVFKYIQELQSFCRLYQGRLPSCNLTAYWTGHQHGKWKLIGPFETQGTLIKQWKILLTVGLQLDGF